MMKTVKNIISRVYLCSFNDDMIILEVIYLKKQLHLIGVLLVLLLSFSLLGVTAFADPIGLSGGETISLMVNVDRSNGEPASYVDQDGNEVQLNSDQVLYGGTPAGVCTVSVVDRSNQETGSGYDSLSSLLYSDLGIRIVPLDGYYVSALSLTTDGSTGSTRSLLSGATANLNSTAVTLYPVDIAISDGAGGYSLNSDYLASWGGGAYTLNVTCKAVSPDAHGITYYSNGSQVGDYSADYGAWMHSVRNAFSETAYPDGMEPDYMLLRYNGQDGAVRKVNAGDTVSVYDEASIELVWKQSEAMEETYVEDAYVEGTFIEEEFVDAGGEEAVYIADPAPSYSVPAVTLQAPDQSKEFDGYPLTMDAGVDHIVVQDGAGLSYNVAISYSGGSITDIGSIPNQVTNYEVSDMDGKLLYDKAALDNSGVFTVLNGTLTVYAPSVLQPLTVTAVTDEVTVTTSGQEVYASACGADKGFTNGYSVSGLLNGHHVEGEGIVSSFGTASFVTEVNAAAVRVKMDNGQDVTPLYSVQGVNGYITVIENIAPTYTVPTASVSAPSQEKEFDGTPLTVDAGTAYTEVVGADGITYKVAVSYAGGSITDIGSVENTVTSYEIYTPDNVPIFDKAAIDQAGTLTVQNGTISVVEPSAKQTLTVTAVTAEVTVTTKDQEVYASACGADAGFVNGYKAEGLLDGHHIEGDNIVTSHGTASFDTAVNTENIRVKAENGQDVTVLYNIQGVNGYITVIEDIAPTYTVPSATVSAPSREKQYDGTPLTVESGTEYTDVVGADGITYKVAVSYAGGSITDIGSIENTVTSYEIYTPDDVPIFDKAAIDQAGTLTVQNGTIAVKDPSVKQPLTVTAVTAEVTVTTAGAEVYAADCGTDAGFTNGYKVAGLLDGHHVEGSDIVTSHGTASFETTVNTGNISVKMENGQDVTALYDIQGVNGYVTVKQPVTPDPEPQPDPDPVIPTVTIQAVTDSKPYDGTALTKDSSSGYTVSPADGLGNYVLKVTFGSVTEPGSVATITDYALCNQSGDVVFDKAALDGSSNFTIDPGTLTVTKRHLTITAISGEINSHGETFTASELSTQDGSFTNGYKVEGLLSGHTVSGVVVKGSGNTSFVTSVATDSVRVSDSSSWDVTGFYDVANIERVDGCITIHDLTPVEPDTFTLIVNPRSYTWIYDGQEHRLYEYDSNGLVDGDRLSQVSYKASSAITNVGSVYNEITAVEVKSSTGGDVAENKYKLVSTPGILRVTQRDLTVTAISGTLSNTQGKQIVASSLSKPDENFTSGYKAEGLVTGHTLSGNFVTGYGTTTFNTGIDLNQLRVLDANGVDVTQNYRITTVGGVVTINDSTATPTRTNVPLTVSAKSGTFTYDGNDHSLNEYTVSGLVDGDVIDKVSFKSSSVIRNVGSVANEIQSVVIKSSTGAAVDSSKYSIRYVPATLTVTKFPITLTAVSDSKAYDGKALVNKSVKASALANSSHTLSADYDVFDINGNTIMNGPVDPGTYTKKVSNVVIKAGSQDVTSNYEIKTIDGTLTITGTGGSSSARSTTNTAYYGNTYSIRSDANYADFLYLLIDGQRVSADNYTVKEGSTIVTLKAAYVQSLKTGNHNYTIVSKTSQADGTFNVAKAPKTGDGARTALWIVLFLLAALAVAVTLFLMKRSGKLGGGKPPRGTPPRGGSSRSAASRGTASAKASSTAKAAAAAAAVTHDDDVTAESVLNFDMLDKAEEKDPTSDLVKDLDIDLDAFRTPVDGVSAAAQETLPDIEVELFEEPAEPEMPTPRGRHEKPSAPEETDPAKE